MLAYHGSPNRFDCFEPGAHKKYGRYEDYGDFFFFSSSRRVACAYRSQHGQQNAGYLYTVELDIKRPLIMDGAGKAVHDIISGKLLLNGYDGVIIQNVYDYPKCVDRDAIVRGIATDADFGIDEPSSFISVDKYLSLDSQIKEQYLFKPRSSFWKGEYLYRGRHYRANSKMPPGLTTAIKNGLDERYKSYPSYAEDAYIRQEKYKDLYGCHTTYVVPNPSQIHIIKVES